MADTTVGAVDGHEPELKLRSYQQEMLDISAYRNVIVAVDAARHTLPGLSQS